MITPLMALIVTGLVAVALAIAGLALFYRWARILGMVAVGVLFIGVLARLLWVTWSVVTW